MAPGSPATCDERVSRWWRSTVRIVRTATVGASQTRWTRSQPLVRRCREALPVHARAILLVAAGDNAQRLRDEAAWAHLCGVAPIEASSGKVTRYRLNRGGNRQANHALYRIVITRMAGDPRTRSYVERRTIEGRSKAEIIRILKRYVAREIFKHLPSR